MSIHLFKIALVFGLWLGGISEHLRAESPIRAGDRVAIIGNTFADQLRIHGYLETLLLQHWPDDPPSIRNLGWGGDMLTARDRPTNFPTEESTLREHRTDVIVACFGMGESFAGEEGVADFRRDVGALIDAHTGKMYNGESAVRLILVSPIAYENLGNVTPKCKQRNRQLANHSQVMGEVAASADVPFADLYQPSRYLMDEPIGPNLATNGIHLNEFGYWALSHVLYRNLVADDGDANLRPWHVFVDAKAKTVKARGVTASDFSANGVDLVFNVSEMAGPTLPPPTDQDLPPQLNHQRDTMTVANLQPGTYAFSVDGKTVIAASHKAWADGIAIDSSPSHHDAEAFRSAVNDKNLQFTYSWKALNQVHIVGERKSSPSGKALPAEVIEFKKLADERDEQLRRPIEHKTRRWRLDRVGP
jgi:hypothetical protein